jgi:hypothetical protein
MPVTVITLAVMMHDDDDDRRDDSDSDLFLTSSYTAMIDKRESVTPIVPFLTVIGLSGVTESRRKRAMIRAIVQLCDRR